MDSAAEPEPKPTSTPPRLALYSIKATASPDHRGMLTPPHRNTLSVPFRWEKEPGKPLPCLALTTTIPNDKTPKSLELPPRLALPETKLPSPTTVLDGPYAARRRGFQTSSFRKLSFSPESGSLGALVLSKRRGGFKVKGLFGSFWSRRVLSRGRGGNNKEVSGGSYVFPSSGDRESDGVAEEESSSEKVKKARIRRGGSFSNLAYPRSHFWEAIYSGLKQAVPWKNKKMVV